MGFLLLEYLDSIPETCVIPKEEVTMEGIYQLALDVFKFSWQFFLYRNKSLFRPNQNMLHRS
jgi:hypothetical protein